MNGANEASRRDFLKFIPKYLAYGARSFTEELSKPADVQAQTATVEAVVDSRAKIAEIDTNCCIAWGGGSCQFCYLACPLRNGAISIEDQKPVIHPSICDGCAKCITACETVNTTPAIKMVTAR